MNNISPNYYTNLESDSAMIQAAVDAAAKSGEAVTIDRHNMRTNSDVWIIDKSIKLHSGSSIYLNNCILRQAEGVYDNIFINSNLASGEWKNADGRQKGIRIIGVGNSVLENICHNDLNEDTHSRNGLPHIYSNCMILFNNVEDVIIENLKIIEQRYWALNFSYSSDVRISNIKFYAPHTVINQDGIDLRTGCNNFLIENISGVTGDDTVALTCIKSIYDEDMAKLNMDTSIHDVVIRNVHSKTPCSVVRLLNHGGKKLYNITVENVGDVLETHEFEVLDIPSSRLRPGACVRIGENFYFGGGKKAEIFDTYNITVRNVTSRARMAVRASCALSSAVIEDIKVYADGGTAMYFGEGRMKNVIVRDIFYPVCYTPSPEDDNRRENHFNQQHNRIADPERKLCAVYFKEGEAENLVFQNIYASDGLSSVFGGTGKVSMKAENIFKSNPALKDFDGELDITKL